MASCPGGCLRCSRALRGGPGLLKPSGVSLLWPCLLLAPLPAPGLQGPAQASSHGARWRGLHSPRPPHVQGQPFPGPPSRPARDALLWKALCGSPHGHPWGQLPTGPFWKVYRWSEPSVISSSSSQRPPAPRLLFEWEQPRHLSELVAECLRPGRASLSPEQPPCACEKLKL